MDLSPIQQQALQRWNELGDTTPTHPVLTLAYQLFYQPLGLTVDALRYDALAALADRPNSPIEFIQPRWSAAKVDRSWEQFPVIEPLLSLTDYLDPLFNSNGTLAEFAILRDIEVSDDNNSIMSTAVNAGLVDRFQKFQETQSDAIFDLCDALSIATKVYIDTSLDLLIQPGSKVSEDCAKLFVEHPKRYPSLAYEMFTTRPPAK